MGRAAQRVPSFHLRFDPTQLRAVAARYSFAPDDAPRAAGERARELGYYGRSDFLDICRWKSRRSERLCASNSAEFVREVSQIAFSTREERLRIGILTLLRGVGWPTASVLLHFALPDRYPILDFRALWSLGIDKPPTPYTFEFWDAYTASARRIAEEYGVKLRELDRALWQYSKEEQNELANGNDRD